MDSGSWVESLRRATHLPLRLWGQSEIWHNHRSSPNRPNILQSILVHIFLIILFGFAESLECFLQVFILPLIFNQTLVFISCVFMFVFFFNFFEDAVFLAQAFAN